VEFANRYGGSVVPWEEAVAQAEATKPLATERFQSAVTNRSNWADNRVTAASGLWDRRTSVVVGEDAPSIEAAVAAAPPNTTVEVPAGTYSVQNLTVNKSVTIDGVGNGTHLRGNGNGTVIRLTASRAALTDIRVTGVGDIGSRRLHVNESRLNGLEWSENVQLAYGRGDAAVKVLNASQSLIENVHIQTPSSGVIVLHSRGTVIRESNITVIGGPEKGFMGLVSMYDSIVVEDSSFYGGRDGIYTHRADGIVIRNNEFADGRYGVHEMYTSRSLVANNSIRNERTGIIIMTRPSGNAVVGNDIRDSEVGLSVSGSDAYYAENTLVGNGRGLDILGSQSLIKRNTVLQNRIGIRDATALPTNIVVANDIVDNGQPAISGREPLRVYTSDGQGNYWGPVPGADSDDDSYYERTYRPTGTVGSLVDEEPGAWALARAPAYTLVRGLQSTVPGLRSSGIIDTAPRTRPERPSVLASLQNQTNSTTRSAA
jgi:nitrous oxidase accessory protein NosD